MNGTNDTPPVITVDWNAVERELDQDIPTEQREKIERTGNTVWGSPAPDSSEPAVIERHASLYHPERGPLDSLYIPFDSTSCLAAAFKQALDGPFGLRDTIDQWDSETFLAGVADLYDAATALTRRGGDWYNGRHPVVAGDGFGAHTLSTLYVRLAHTDPSAIEQLPIDDLPLERASVFQWDTASKDHYTALYRHEDCPDDSAVEGHVRVSEYADDIDLLDVYVGSRRFRRSPLYRSGDFLKLNPIDFSQDPPTTRTDVPHLFTGDILHPLPPTAPKSKLYYEKSANVGRCAHEWVEWPRAESTTSPARTSLTHVFLFDGTFDETAVEAATLLDRHRLDESVGDHFGTPPTASEIAHTLRGLSPDDEIQLELSDGRQITATVSEGPYYTPVSWSNGERTTGSLGVVVDATKSEDYRWLNEEQNGRIEISADERRGWKPPFASTWRMYDTDGVTTDDHWIALGTVLDVDTGAS